MQLKYFALIKYFAFEDLKALKYTNEKPLKSPLRYVNSIQIRELETWSG